VELVTALGGNTVPGLLDRVIAYRTLHFLSLFLVITKNKNISF
jgi:hypothetical protein